MNVDREHLERLAATIAAGVIAQIDERRGSDSFNLDAIAMLSVEVAENIVGEVRRRHPVAADGRTERPPPTRVPGPGIVPR